MSYFDPYGQRGPGWMEIVFGWLVGMIILLVAFGLMIRLLVPLLPWIGAAMLVVIFVRWWLLRMERW